MKVLLNIVFDEIIQVQLRLIFYDIYESWTVVQKRQ